MTSKHYKKKKEMSGATARTTLNRKKYPKIENLNRRQGVCDILSANPRFSTSVKNTNW